MAQAPSRFPPTVRRITLTAHVIASVGWLGGVAAFLALAVTGLTHRDPLTVRAAYVATDVLTWLVIVPLAATSLITGVVQSLGTAWGLFRHYWVVTKLLLTVAATALLLLHTQPIATVARAAGRGRARGRRPPRAPGPVDLRRSRGAARPRDGDRALDLQAAGGDSVRLAAASRRQCARRRRLIHSRMQSGAGPCGSTPLLV